MTDTSETAVARHYGLADLETSIHDGIRAAGLDPARLRPEDLAPVDEFHTAGRASTVHVLAKMRLSPDHRVLDVGCGIGGATRYLASEFGCRVAGIDLTPEYIDVARKLARLTGFDGRVEYRVASALDMPFDAASFDAAVTFHAAMNIKDRAKLYREIARVVKPGAELAIFDVMKGPRDGLKFPVPWAESPAISHLASMDETVSYLHAADFAVVETEDRSAFAIDYFRKALAPSGEPAPPLGLHLLTGPNLREKMTNYLAGLESGCILPGIVIARRAG